MARESETSSVGLAEAKNNLSALTAKANQTGTPFTILKNNRPWVEVRPLASHTEEKPSAITITPLHQTVEIPDLDALFEGYEGTFEPQEDGFAAASGLEAM